MEIKKQKNIFIRILSIIIEPTVFVLFLFLLNDNYNHIYN